MLRGTGLSQTHELAAAGIVKMSAMRSGNHFTFILFDFPSFVATLDTEKQRETRRKTSWETNWETRETRPREDGHTIQRREKRKTNWETSLGTQETRLREGGHISNKGK